MGFSPSAQLAYMSGGRRSKPLPEGWASIHLLSHVLTVKARALGYNKNNETLWHIIENNLRQSYFDSCILCSYQPYLYIFKTGFNQTVSANPNLR